MSEKISDRIDKILNFYPVWIQNLVRNHIKLMPEERVISKKRVGASYHHETGNILIWNPKFENQADLLIILSHEIGHKIFHEELIPIERKEWFSKTSEENIDNSIKWYYPSKVHLEEHFCWLFSGWTYSLYLKKLGETKKMRKFITDMQKKYPKGTKFLRQKLRKRHRVKKNTPTSYHCDLRHEQVIAFKKWLKEVLGPSALDI